MGLKLRATSCSIWRTAFLVSVLTVLAGTAVPDRAYAEGFLDFLFGGFQRPSPPPAAPPPTPTVGRVAPPALGHESVSGISSIGRTVGYCVRLCDGQHFPIGQIVYGSSWRGYLLETPRPSLPKGSREKLRGETTCCNVGRCRGVSTVRERPPMIRP